MATGDLSVNQHWIDPKYSSKDASLYSLLFHWDKQLLRFILMDARKEQVYSSGIYKRNEKEDTLGFLDGILKSCPFLKDEFESVWICQSGINTTLVPYSLYDYRKKAELLNSSEEIQEHRHSKISAVLLSEESDTDTWFKRSYPNCKIYPNDSLLLESLIRKHQFSKSNHMYIEMHLNQLSILCFVGGQFKLQNTFSWEHANDVLYHSINVAQQCGTEVDQCELTYGGFTFGQTEITDLLSQYFTTIQIGLETVELTWNNNPMKEHKEAFSSLNNLYTCAS